jgi:carbonic anhydrase
MKNRTLLATTLLLAGASLVVNASSAGHGSSVSPQAALSVLQDGNARYALAETTSGKPTAHRRAEIAQGQHPFAIVVACADSRVSPELLFDQNLGDLFVIRTAGNLVDDHGLGSIEYAVEHLGTRLVVVLGHERCGAVTAALGSPTAPGHVNTLVRDIQPAVAAAKGKPGDPLVNTIAANARLVVDRIQNEAVLGDLTAEVLVVPAIYDLDTGRVEFIKD